MVSKEITGHLPHHLSSQGLPETRLGRFFGLNREVNFGRWFFKLPKEDQHNVKNVGDWLSAVVSERGEVWAVGSTVRSVRRGKDALGNDIDLQIFARCPNQAMIELVETALEQAPPPGFALKKEQRFDDDTGKPYFNAELFPVNGRVIHLLSPKPWEMTPEDERKFRRWSPFSGPFSRLEKRFP